MKLIILATFLIVGCLSGNDSNNDSTHTKFAPGKYIPSQIESNNKHCSIDTVLIMEPNLFISIETLPQADIGYIESSLDTFYYKIENEVLSLKREDTEYIKSPEFSDFSDVSFKMKAEKDCGSTTITYTIQ